MIDHVDALRRAEDWIASWNAHDIDAILAHYPESFEFVSPVAARQLDRPDGTIRSKEELRAYFSPHLGPGSPLRFELIDVFAGVSGITIHYRNHRGQRAAETMMLDDDGRAERVVVHYLTD